MVDSEASPWCVCRCHGVDLTMVPSAKPRHLSYKSQSSTRRSPRSKLVFWLRTGVCIMVQFETIKALDLVLVSERFVRAMLLFLLLVGFALSRVGVCSRDGAFSTFSVPLILFFLLFFLSFLGQLRLLGTWQWFCSSNLRFFRSKILHGATLALGNGRVGWSIAPKAVLIYLFSAKARLESQLCLGVDGLFDYLIKVFQLEVSVF